MTSKSLLITDLDNTLWDWFAAWHAAFSAMLESLELESGVPAAVLEPEIRAVHQLRATSEYSHLLNEVPSLIERANGVPPMVAYDAALHAFYSARRANTRLYPEVRQTLVALRERGVMIVAYTESIAYATEWRIKHTGLDGIIDVLYSAPDHDLPVGVTFDEMRKGNPDDYGLETTDHRHVPKGAFKPNVDILRSILHDCGRSPSEAVYVGDSLIKDIVMAQEAGVLDVHAKYGEPQQREEYQLLQRVSHWPDRDVQREQEVIHSGDIVPTRVLPHGFGEITTVWTEETATNG